MPKPHIAVSSVLFKHSRLFSAALCGLGRSYREVARVTSLLGAKPRALQGQAEEDHRVSERSEFTGQIW
ncbi:hypothetical protein PGIGA_G00254540 [Pangasianodon gigas]|uniref:Uncharacterized protein n=1 Tax=Pangasianodon gigas TaxID=30993 RepID=A0ACC5WRP3_PANGG|nr:hypothetical protein [Pangasianodon gigas]